RRCRRSCPRCRATPRARGRARGPPGSSPGASPWRRVRSPRAAWARGCARRRPRGGPSPPCGRGGAPRGRARRPAPRASPAGRLLPGLRLGGLARRRLLVAGGGGAAPELVERGLVALGRRGEAVAQRVEVVLARDREAAQDVGDALLDDLVDLAEVLARALD